MKGNIFNSASTSGRVVLEIFDKSMRKISRLELCFQAINGAQMNERTKRIFVRRRIGEVIVVKQVERIKLVCDNGGSEQSFRLAENLKIDDEIKNAETHKN